MMISVTLMATGIAVVLRRSRSWTLASRNAGVCDGFWYARRLVYKGRVDRTATGPRLSPTPDMARADRRAENLSQEA